MGKDKRQIRLIWILSVVLAVQVVLLLGSSYFFDETKNKDSSESVPRPTQRSREISSASTKSTKEYPGTNNLHLIDALPNGFAIFRSGVPDEGDIATWCSLGISEVMVMSGDAGKREVRFGEQCPTLKVVYDERQNVKKPVTPTFLKFFDDWVESARKEGKKILFRCQCGCHRTGRLAAYYELKYLGYSVEQTLDNLDRFGKNMQNFPMLPFQIKALEDYYKGRTCRYRKRREIKRYCVRP